VDPASGEVWQIRYDPSHIHSGLIHWYADGRLYMTGENLRVFSRGGGPLNGLTVTVACDSWLRRSRLSLDTRPARNTAWSYGSAGRMETVSQGGATVTCQCVANATAVLHKGATPPYNAPWLQGWTRWIAPQTIQLGDLGPVGGDGFLYKVLPDGETFDFTPRVKHKEFYHFGVGQQKHKLRLAANGYVLEPDKVVAGAAFCVGQKVTFTAQWDPALVGVSSNAYDWVMSTKYVNHSWQHCRYDEFGNAIYYGSVNYDRDAEVLKLAAPWAWWVTGGDKNVKLDLTVHFDNGQSATVPAWGKFGMFRPCVSREPFDKNVEPSFYAVGSANPFAPPHIALGGDEDPRQDGKIHQMTFYVKFDAGAYSGTGSLVQLLTMDYSAPFLNPLDPPSFSDWRLDGASVAYSTGQIEAERSPSPWNRVLFDDAPGRGHMYSPWGAIRCKASFKDYVMFKPEGNDSVAVPLGIITWSCDGRSPDVGTLDINSVTGPNGPNGEDEFPMWEKVYSPGSRGVQ